MRSLIRQAVPDAAACIWRLRQPRLGARWGRMDFQQLFLSPQGRLNRKPYWIGVLILTAVQFASEFAFGGFDRGVSVPAIVVSLLLIYPNAVLGIKRCHDRDRSGWFLLIVLIPLLGALWLLVELGFLRGTAGPNRFGPDPLATLQQSGA